MAFFGRIFGSSAAPVEACAHERLTPRWRGPQAMPDEAGDESEAMGYVCNACGAEFPPYRVRDRRLTGYSRSGTPGASRHVTRAGRATPSPS